MEEKDVTKKVQESLQGASEALKTIQFAGSTDRLKIQDATSYMKQEIHTHNQLLQGYDAEQSTRRMELLQQIADAAALGELEEMSRLKHLLDQLQSQ